MLRPFVTLALMLFLALGLTTASRLIAQDQDEPKPEAPAVEAPQPDTDQPEAADAPEAEAEAPPPTIPPEVEAKLDEARRAVAEAIVAAQEAGLVETSIDPPPILDILITGRALDRRELSRELTERQGVSPEVFGAWFTGYGAMEGVTPEDDVRIMQPSQGLKEWYDRRAEILNRYIEEARRAREADTDTEEDTDTPAETETEPQPEPETEEPETEEPESF